jgi:putative ABC transport system ATP-binding protein
MIEVRRLTKYYDDGSVKALNGVSLRIEKGEIVSLVGPSGSGKSTLLNLIGTIDQPTGGQICINGKTITDYKPFDVFRARTIGFIFQLHHLLPHLTLVENVEIAMYRKGIRRNVRRKKALRLLHRVGLMEKVNSFPTKISAGERQRAAIARALANDPQILLADEPTGSIDTETGDRILDFVIDQCRNENMTMIIATHNYEVAERTDRTIYIKNGLIQGQN